MDMSVYLTLLCFTGVTTSLELEQLPLLQSRHEQTTGAEAIHEVLQSLEGKYVIALVHDKTYSRSKIVLDLPAPHGIGMFDCGNNCTQSQVLGVIRKIQTVSNTYMPVLVLVASDDSVFLSTFAWWSLKNCLLVWNRRLLIFTRLQLQSVHHLARTLAVTNSLLLTPNDDCRKVLVSAVFPYNGRSNDSVPVAVWTPRRGLTGISHIQLFPEKFKKLNTMQKLLVAMTEDAMHRKVLQEDPTVPGKKRVTFEGYMVDVMDYVAKGLNFSYTFVPSPDNSYGNKEENGTWSGMVGQVKREEVDIGLGPFTVTRDRAEVVDFMWPVEVTSGRILAGQRQLEVDPWGFILPLSPTVWGVVLFFCVLLPGIAFILSCSCMDTNWLIAEWKKEQFDFLSMFLQESIKVRYNSWLWEYILLGVWMLTTLVLRRSYEGNLMSLLAVRYVPQPYQSLRDVLQDTSSVMIWKKGSSFVELIESSASGIFREVLESKKRGRVRFLGVKEYLQVLEKDVINGNQVIIDFAFNLIPINGNYFSQTGKCSVYIGRERLISQSLGMIGQKGNPIVPAITDRILSMMEAGLYNYWYTQAIPNSTSCKRSSSKVTVSTFISLSNSWAMFVMLLGGHAVSFAFLVLEFIF